MILGLFVSSALFATELAWVDEQIEAIKPPRKSTKISSITNPFIFLSKNKTQSKDAKKGSKSATARRGSTKASSKLKKVVCDTTTGRKSIRGLTLSAIINSSAMINESWYKKNDKVKGYRIIDITKTSVTLKKGDKKLTLSTNTKKQNLKFKNK